MCVLGRQDMPEFKLTSLEAYITNNENYIMTNKVPE